MASAAFPDGPEDTKAQIPVDQPSGNNLVIADTQGTILRYVEDIILDGCEEKLAAAKRTPCSFSVLIISYILGLSFWAPFFNNVPSRSLAINFIIFSP